MIEKNEYAAEPDFEILDDVMVLKNKADEKPSNLINSIIDSIEKAMSYLSIFATAVIMLLVTVDATARYFFNNPITGVYEITEEYLMVTVIFLALSWAYSAGAHVRVTLFIKFIPERIMFYIDLVLKLISLVFFILVVAAGWDSAVEALKLGHRSASILKYPIAPALFLVPLGIGTLCLRIIQDIVRDIIPKKGQGGI